MGAWRMARELAGQTRYLKRALVARPAHALGERLRRAVEALARTGDDRLAPWQSASERAQVAAQAVGKAQDRAAAARVEFGNRREQFGADRDREFRRCGRRRRAQI